MNSRIVEYIRAIHAESGLPLSTVADETTLNEAEELLQCKLPIELRNWLKQYNSGGHFYAIGQKLKVSVTKVLEIENTWLENGWFPVAADGCGNDYVLITKGDCGPGHPVGFIDNGSDSEVIRYLVASDLEHFIEFFLEKMVITRTQPERLASGFVALWPFDRETVIAKDPGIESLYGAPLPWNT